MKKLKVITRGSLTYYIYEEKVIVGAGGDQFISYNQYENWNRQGITQFINTLLKSKEHEYGTPAEQISLAIRCGIRGSSTKRPEL